MSTLQRSLALLAAAALMLLGLPGCESSGSSSSGSNVKSGFGRTTTTSQIMGQHRRASR